MAYPAPKVFTSWSNSRLNLYDQCPYKAKLVNLEKRPEPKNAAMTRGIDIHALAEQYLKGVRRLFPPELKLHAPLFKAIRAQVKRDPASVIIEDNWAFTKSWGPSRWDDWANCWLRVKLDCAVRDGNVVTIYDFKTGKYRTDNFDEYTRQLELYALTALLVFSSIGAELQVSPRLVYLDTGDVYGSEVYNLSDVPKLKKTWEKRVKPMMNDKVFAPKPNRWCPWCYFRKDNGGPCQY